MGGIVSKNLFRKNWNTWRVSFGRATHTLGILRKTTHDSVRSSVVRARAQASIPGPARPSKARPEPSPPAGLGRAQAQARDGRDPEPEASALGSGSDYSL
ncbi:hypothetical protein BD626DRAFT_499371, partial [Schizophyllum amplum]